MAEPPPPAPPYIPAKYQGGRQDTLTRIVIHSAVIDLYCGAAKAIAEYFQDPSYESSAHYAVDNCEEYQCVYDHTVAWHDGHNQNSIGVEMCERPEHDADRWSTGEHPALLRRTAKLVRQLCLAYDIPIRKLTPDQVAAGWKGICGHDDIRDAFPGSTTHWDPGGFPWDEFIALAQEDDMPLSKDDVRAIWKTDGILRNRSASGDQDEYWMPASFLEHIEDTQDEEHKLLKQVHGEVTAIRTKLAAHDDPERLKRIVQDAIGELDFSDLAAEDIASAVVRQLGEYLTASE